MWRKALISAAVVGLLAGCTGFQLKWSASYAYPGQEAAK